MLRNRTTVFWSRASKVYLTYKVAQVKAWGLKQRGLSTEEIREKIWLPQHEWAGREFYSMAVDLRGFYLKVRFWIWNLRLGLTWSLGCHAPPPQSLLFLPPSLPPSPTPFHVSAPPPLLLPFLHPLPHLPLIFSLYLSNRPSVALGPHACDRHVPSVWESSSPSACRDACVRVSFLCACVAVRA